MFKITISKDDRPLPIPEDDLLSFLREAITKAFYQRANGEVGLSLNVFIKVGREKKSEIKRDDCPHETLTEKMLEFFADDTYATARIQDVCRECGKTIGSPYERRYKVL